MKILETKNYIHYLYVRYNDCWKKLAFKEIVFLKSLGNHTELNLWNSKKQYYVMKSLEQYEKELPFIFFRSHRSTIVNMAYIRQIDKGKICMADGTYLPVSKSRKLLLEEKLANLPALIIPHCRHCENCPDVESCEIIHPFILEQKDIFCESR
jgi:DNA-binding LytR/AlgR family response regulator